MSARAGGCPTMRTSWRVLSDLRDEAQARGLRFLVALAPCARRHLLGRGRPRGADRARRPACRHRAARPRPSVRRHPDRVLPAADRATLRQLRRGAGGSGERGARPACASTGGGRLLFCPTEYCGRMAGGDPRGSDLPCRPWRGPRPRNRRLLDRARDRLARDHADDLRRWPGCCGASRSSGTTSTPTTTTSAASMPVRWADATPDILPLVDGWITNPNNEAEANFVAVRHDGRVPAARIDREAAITAPCGPGSRSGFPSATVRAAKI